MGRRKKIESPQLLDAAASGASVAEPVPAAQSVAPALPVVKVWRVKTEAIVSLFGHVTTLPAGSLVSAALYGPDGLARIRAQADLEPVR